MMILSPSLVVSFSLPSLISLGLAHTNKMRKRDGSPETLPYCKARSASINIYDKRW